MPYISIPPFCPTIVAVPFASTKYNGGVQYADLSCRMLQLVHADADKELPVVLNPMSKRVLS